MQFRSLPKARVVVLLLALVAPLTLPLPAVAADCEFVLGFKTLRDLVNADESRDKVGACLDSERYNPENGDSLQHSAGGLLVWRKADNGTAFTDGYRTWINGPQGLQARLNTERFDWEAGADVLPVETTGYSDSEHGFTLQVPVGWANGDPPGGGIVSFTGPEEGDGARPSIVVKRHGSGSNDLETFVARAREAAVAIVPGYVPGDAGTTTVGTLPGWFQEYAVEAQSLSTRGRQTFVLRDEHVYALTMTALASTWDHHAPLFRAVEQSLTFTSPAPATDSGRPTLTLPHTEAQLSEARTNLVATTVGTTVLFAGGGDALFGSPSAVVDLYDGDTGRWSTATLTEARGLLAATTVGKKALFAGGLADVFESSSVVDIYDSTSRSWSTAELSVARDSLAATAVEGKALFAGGEDAAGKTSAAVDIYDAETGSWSTAVLSLARQFLAAASVGGKALFAGGVDEASQSSAVVDIYDGATGRWSTATLSQARDQLAAISAGTLALFAGGEDTAATASSVVDIYDSATGEWSTATLSAPRRSLGAAVVGDLVLIAGGWDGEQDRDVIDVFNAATGTWSVTTLSQARDSLAAATAGMKILFAGGEDDVGTSSAVVDIFDLPSDGE
ncbi:MAG: hypothetical protein CL878_15595 [Dehalococcoidia bacterium]|nr:hypothetical protein [Dehalococcoidia bacterium]